MRRAIGTRGSFNAIHLATMFKVDIFVCRDRPYARERMARSSYETLSTAPERRARFAAPEDVVLAKLEWYRLGGEVSDRQWRDVLGVIKTQGERLDSAYLGRWARELAVQDLLARAMADARN